MHSWQGDHRNNSHLFEALQPVELFTVINNCLFQSVLINLTFKKSYFHSTGFVKHSTLLTDLQQV